MWECVHFTFNASLVCTFQTKNTKSAGRCVSHTRRRHNYLKAPTTTNKHLLTPHRCGTQSANCNTSRANRVLLHSVTVPQRQQITPKPKANICQQSVWIALVQRVGTFTYYLYHTAACAHIYACVSVCVCVCRSSCVYTSMTYKHI